MAEMIVVLVIVGIAVLVAWPLARRAHRNRSATDQPAVTDRSPVPPRRPSRPVPGSQPDRERKR